MGRSLVVDPECKIQASLDDSEPDIINVDFDLDEVKRVRAEGTAGTNRMWSQFRPEDPAIPLEVYEGAIDPKLWEPTGQK